MAGINDSKRDRRALEREQMANREARIEAATRNHHERQLDILLELQDGLRELMRSTVRVILADRKTLKEHGKTFQLPEDVNLHAYDARINYLRLIQRVTHDELRSKLEALSEFATTIVMSSVRTESGDPQAEIAKLDRLQSELASRHEEVSHQLGIHLRSELTYEWIAPISRTN